MCPCWRWAQRQQEAAQRERPFGLAERTGVGPVAVDVAVHHQVAFRPAPGWRACAGRRRAGPRGRRAAPGTRRRRGARGCAASSRRGAGTAWRSRPESRRPTRWPGSRHRPGVLARWPAARPPRSAATGSTRRHPAPRCPLRAPAHLPSITLMATSIASTWSVESRSKRAPRRQQLQGLTLRVELELLAHPSCRWCLCRRDSPAGRPGSVWAPDHRRPGRPGTPCPRAPAAGR